VSLYEQVFAAIGDQDFPAYTFPAPIGQRGADAYVTVMRKGNTQAYELNGARGLNTVPVSVVAWSKSLEMAQELGRRLVGLLEPYTSSTVRKVFIGRTDVMFDPRTETHGYRLMAEFVTTEE
jgi:hypothetical protein